MDTHDHSRPVPSALEDFVALLEAHGAPLFRYLLRMVGDRALAEDLLQETFASAFGHRDEFRQPGSVRAWLFAIARNRARNALRDGRRTVTDSTAVARELGKRPGVGSPEVEVLRLELRAEILAALQQLPPARREAIVLRDIEGSSYGDIAAATESSEGAVRVRVHRGRQQLQSLLAPYLEEAAPATQAVGDREERE
jgi:RNA polymerase sigma-70 factor (ECF subfamily)